MTQRATLYLNSPVAPGSRTWVYVYEIRKHDATGITVLDGENEVRFYPAHLIERIDYK